MPSGTLECLFLGFLMHPYMMYSNCGLMPPILNGVLHCYPLIDLFNESWVLSHARRHYEKFSLDCYSERKVFKEWHTSIVGGLMSQAK
jgi:hypothetical protein